jgi:hypothetical protein
MERDMPEDSAPAPAKKAVAKKKAAPKAPEVKEGTPVGVSADDYGKPASVHRMVIDPS